MLRSSIFLVSVLLQGCFSESYFHPNPEDGQPINYPSHGPDCADDGSIERHIGELYFVLSPRIRDGQLRIFIAITSPKSGGELSLVGEGVEITTLPDGSVYVPTQVGVFPGETTRSDQENTIDLFHVSVRLVFSIRARGIDGFKVTFLDDFVSVAERPVEMLPVRFEKANARCPGPKNQGGWFFPAGPLI